MPTLAALAAVPRWVAWQTEDRNGKPQKVLKNPATTRNASSTEAATWGTRNAAEACVPRLDRAPRGVGIVLGDHLGLAIGGIDLDTCRADADTALDSWAAEVVERFGSYTETSPSGTGAKVFFTYDATDLPILLKAMDSKGGGKKFARPGDDHPPAIELYLSGRYFTVTNQHLDGTPAELRRVSTDTLLWLIREAGPAFVGAKPKKVSSLKELARASTSTDGSRSALAFRIAREVKRDGGTDQDVLDALKADQRASEWLEEKGSASGGRELRRLLDRATVADDDLELTEDGVALAFEQRHGDALRYCHDTGKWFVWSGTHWQLNRDKQAFTWSRELVRSLNRSAEFKTKAITGKAAFAGSVEKFAQSARAFAVTAEIWDRDPFLLGTPGGTVDLQTGQLRPARREDYITKRTAVAPAAATDCPTWFAFLRQATAGDNNLILFLQQWAGYCLTGSTREHALMFIYGPGGNGKSVFLNTVSRILGDYCRTAPMDTFTSSNGDKHPTDLAMLRGARLVTATETEEGRAWAESRIKQMTGGDPVSARFMRQDFFTYTPQFKLMIAGNHKPALRNVDEAARRRFNIVPFLHKPEAPDRQLEKKLMDEAPGILRWMIEGCLDWQRSGLERPKIVTDATAEYFEAQDTIGRWMAERCILASHLEEKPGKLLRDLQEWSQQNGEPITDNRKLRGTIEKTPGCRYVTVKGSQVAKGIGLRPPAKGGGVEGGGG